MGAAMLRYGGHRAAAGVATKHLAEAPPHGNVTADARAGAAMLEVLATGAQVSS